MSTNTIEKKREIQKSQIYFYHPSMTMPTNNISYLQGEFSTISLDNVVKITLGYYYVWRESCFFSQGLPFKYSKHEQQKSCDTQEHEPWMHKSNEMYELQDIQYIPLQLLGTLIIIVFEVKILGSCCFQDLVDNSQGHKKKDGGIRQS